MKVRAALILSPWLLVACSSGGGAKPDASGNAGTTGAAGTGAAGADASAGSGGQDAADAPAADAPATEVADAPAGDAADAPAGPAPVLLASVPGCGDARLAVAGGKVFWTERATGLIRSLAPSSAAGPKTIAINQAMPGPIATDATNVYWANEDKTIMMAPLTGASTAPVLTAPDVVGGLVASGGTLYFGAGPSTYKIAATAAGSAPTTLMTFAVCRTTMVQALALDVDHLYQTDHNNQYLTREKIDGTQQNNNQCAADPTTAPKIMAPDVISHSQGSLLFDALAVANGEIVWADNSNISAKAVGATQAMGSRNAAHTLGGNAITGFTVAGTKLYFGESNEPPLDPGGDAIEMAPLDPGEAGAEDPVVVARGQRNATSFVADADHLYWVTHEPSTTDGGADVCSIMSLAIGAAAP